MRAPGLAAVASLAALSGCGLEGFFGNVGRREFDRPASVIRGSAPWQGAQGSQFSVTDGSGNEVVPFLATASQGAYELRLPSARYSMLVVHARVGNMTLRALVPSLGEESAVEGVDLDARNMTETLAVEARLSADGGELRRITPAAYLGTRALIRQALDQPGPTQELLRMVERVAARADPLSGNVDPDFFSVPRLDPAFAVTSSPLDAGWLSRNPFDYTGSGCPPSPVCSDSAAFDAKLAEVARLYRPAGCPDPNHVRLVFSVDFNAGGLDGNCGAINRFKWAVDKPGKRMFFVGWIYTNDPPGASEVQDPAVNSLLGAGVPNQVPMYDDGTNGDDVTGDNVWTVSFDVPFDPARRLRIGYKYTWGTRGAVWTGSEEWPGNSRILEVVDVNGDGFVHRRDVWGDEATNKDRSNLSFAGNGSIGWTTVLLGARVGCVDGGGAPIPESREHPAWPGTACTCRDPQNPAAPPNWITPQSIGPITVACTGP